MIDAHQSTAVQSDTIVEGGQPAAIHYVGLGNQGISQLK